MDFKNYFMSIVMIGFLIRLELKISIAQVDLD